MVVPTPRALWIDLLGVAALPLAGSTTLALWAGIAWSLTVAILVLVDAALVPVKRQIWKREHDSKLALGAWNPITLQLENHAGRHVLLRVRDAAPPLLLSEGGSGEGLCEAAGVWSLTYRVFPLHRGDYRFGPVTARYLGPLGLAWRQHTTRLQDPVKVYPNLLAIRSYEASLRRGQLEEIGLRSARRWGTGTEFERLREYTSDDEFRRINWKATARLHKPIAVDYQTERSQNILLLIDAGRLMAVRVPLPGLDGSDSPPAWPAEASLPAVSPRALTRLDYAVNAALLLAFVSQQYGDRVGLLAFSDRVLRFVPPRPGRRHFLSLTNALYNLEPESTEPDYAEALAYLATRSPRRGLVVLFTDVGESQGAELLLSQLAHLARRHLTLVVTLRDPGIERLGSLPIADAESLYQRAVARTLLDDREETLLRLRRAGVLTLDVAADALSPTLINRYLEIKARTAL